MYKTREEKLKINKSCITYFLINRVDYIKSPILRRGYVYIECLLKVIIHVVSYSFPSYL